MYKCSGTANLCETCAAKTVTSVSSASTRIAIQGVTLIEMVYLVENSGVYLNLMTFELTYLCTRPQIQALLSQRVDELLIFMWDDKAFELMKHKFLKPDFILCGFVKNPLSSCEPLA